MALRAILARVESRRRHFSC